MTTEQAYKQLCYMIREYADAKGDTAEDFIKNPHKYTDWPCFYGAACQFLVEYMEKMDKSTPARVKSALKRITKSAPSWMTGLLPSDDEKALICNSVCVLRLDTAPPSLPRADNDRARDFGRRLPEMIDQAKAENHTLARKISPAEVKVYVLQTGLKGEMARREPYQVADNYYLRCGLLIDMLEALPDADIYLPDKPSQPAYMIAANGDGIILPVVIRR